MENRPNISTEHQPKGAGKNPSDTLDREADSLDSVHGDAGRQAEERRAHETEVKKDSATAAIDEKGNPMPPPGGPR